MYHGDGMPEHIYYNAMMIINKIKSKKKSAIKINSSSIVLYIVNRTPGAKELAQELRTPAALAE